MIRHLESGSGTPLVHLQPAGALRLTRADELLAGAFRVVALESPASREAVAVVSQLMDAIRTLGIDAFDLMSSSAASTAALALARAAGERVRTLVLESPAPLDARDTGLATPTLVAFGTADTGVTPEISRAFKDALPNSYLVFVYAAGAMIADDRPEAFADVVADFLERHEAFVISRATTVIHP